MSWCPSRRDALSSSAASSRTDSKVSSVTVSATALEISEDATTVVLECGWRTELMGVKLLSC